MPKAAKQGLNKILREISLESPGAPLEHMLSYGPDAELIPNEGEVRKILPVEKWLRTVALDISLAPSPEQRAVITGPHYYWYRDDFGRAIVMAEHRAEWIRIFEEVWAGEPDSLSPEAG